MSMADGARRYRYRKLLFVAAGFYPPLNVYTSVTPYVIMFTRDARSTAQHR